MSNSNILETDWASAPQQFKDSYLRPNKLLLAPSTAKKPAAREREAQPRRKF
jgi:hypothetical protein